MSILHVKVNTTGEWKDIPVMRGPAGPQGEIGPVGPRGETGPKGDTPTIEEIREVFQPDLNKIEDDILSKVDKTEFDSVKSEVEGLNEDLALKVTDVKINGTALAKTDGAVDIPIATTSAYGAVKVGAGLTVAGNGQLILYNASDYTINARLPNYAITSNALDKAVKAALTDGKGADWAADEQKAAWARLGLFEDLKSQITFGTRFAGKVQMLNTNQTTFMRIGNLIFLNIACACLEAVISTDLDYLYQIPPAYAPRANSVGLAYNSSKKISGFCYVRGGSGQIVVKTAGDYGVGNEIDISMFWTI